MSDVKGMPEARLRAEQCRAAFVAAGIEVSEQADADTVVRRAEQASTAREKVAVLDAWRALPRDERFVTRKALAKALGVPVGDLEAKTEADVTADASMPFPPIEQHPQEQNGAVLLEDLSSFFSRHLVLPLSASETLALWVLFAFALDAFQVSPRLFITAPEKECGKSRVLDLLGVVLVRCVRAANITGAVLPRVIEAHRPVILLDEVDTYLDGNHPDLAGIINSGHDREGAWSWRCGEKSQNFEPLRFSTWGAYAFAGIAGKGMPETTLSRCIVVTMRRKDPGEKVDRLTRASRAEGRTLAARCARWAADNSARLEAIDLASDHAPWLERILSDRTADNWRPLVAVAEAAGGTWPTRAVDAATRLSTAKPASDEQPGPMLLADLRVLFEESGANAMATADLLHALTSEARFSERPWSRWRQSRDPLDPRGLAKLLRPYGVHSKDVRVAGGQAKGYELAALASAWDAYAPKGREADGGATAGNSDGAEFAAFPRYHGEKPSFGNADAVPPDRQPGGIRVAPEPISSLETLQRGRLKERPASRDAESAADDQGVSL